MAEAYTYIKKILALLVNSIAGFYLQQFLAYYFLVPLMLLVFSVLIFQITGNKPPYLFDFKRADRFYEKGGLRDLLKLPVTVAGVAYNIIIWTGWGIFLLFEVATDILRLLKIIAFWIIYAILWFLRLFVPPVVILFHLIIHYFIKWIWWIYQLAFDNMVPSVNRNYYFLALRGTIPAIFIVFVFYYFSLIIDLHGLAIVGLVLSVLPLAWSFGEIASVRSKNLQSEGFKVIKDNFQNGVESVRSLLFYITFFVVLLVAQLALNLTGWMPGAGISLLGAAINLNTLISILLILLTLIILFGILMIPTYRLFNYFHENTLSGTVSFFSALIKKGIQYVLVMVPSAIFGTLLLIIPTVLLVASFWLTNTLKNEVLDIKINQTLEQQLETNDELQAYELGKNVEQLRYLKKLPGNLLKEMFNRNNLIYKINNIEDDIRKDEEELLRLENKTNSELASLDSKIAELEGVKNTDESASLKEQKLVVSKAFNKQKANIKLIISKRKIDQKYLQRKSNQVPVIFFLSGVWISLFGGLVLSFLTAYFGNVFYDLYHLRNDGSPYYFSTLFLQEKEKDDKQPLLGFSLLIIVIVIIYLFYRLELPVDLTGNFF